MAEDWTQKASWMRDVGATDAAWSTDGTLVHLRLGPASPTLDTDSTQPSLTPEAKAEAERVERRRVALGSSGGPVRRLGSAGQ